jgi:hypothetical protein
VVGRPAVLAAPGDADQVVLRLRPTMDCMHVHGPGAPALASARTTPVLRPVVVAAAAPDEDCARFQGRRRNSVGASAPNSAGSLQSHAPEANAAAEKH